ncbi:MAG: hypothetical protein ACK5O7_05750 [Holosporales bacterium]
MTPSFAPWLWLNLPPILSDKSKRFAGLYRGALIALGGLLLALTCLTHVNASDPISDQEEDTHNRPVSAINTSQKLRLSPDVYNSIQARCRDQLAQKRARPPLTSVKGLLNFGLKEDRPYLESSGYMTKNPGATKQVKHKHTRGKAHSNAPHKANTPAYYAYPDPTWDWIMKQFELWLENGSPIHDFKPSPRPKLMPHTNFSKLNLCLKTPADAWCFTISWTICAADALSLVQNTQSSFINPTTTEVKNLPIYPEQRQFRKGFNTYAFVIPLVQQNPYKLITQCIFSLKTLQSQPFSDKKEGQLNPNLAFEEAEIEVNCDPMVEQLTAQKPIYVHGACDFILNVDLCSREQSVSLTFSCPLANCNCHKRNKLPGRSVLRIRAV